MLKKFLSVVMVGAMILSLTACGGDNPGKFTKMPSGKEGYLLKDNSYAKSMWVKHGGKEYYFDHNGELAKNAHINSRFFVNEKGEKIKAKGEYCIVKYGSLSYIKGKDGESIEECIGKKTGLKNVFGDDFYEFNRKGEILYMRDGSPVVWQLGEDGEFKYHESLSSPDYEFPENEVY